MPPVGVGCIMVAPPEPEITCGTPADKAVGCVMVMLTGNVFNEASVTTKFQVPAARVKVPVPVYGGLPPVAVTLTDELPPKQGIEVAVA